MKIYYVSLSRGLIGYYVKFSAADEEVVRRHVTKYFGLLWCNIYSEAYFHEIIKKRYPANSRVINRDRAIQLLDESGDWE